MYFLTEIKIPKTIAVIMVPAPVLQGSPVIYALLEKNDLLLWLLETIRKR